ncbi:DUF2163 domain-containing protein [Aurantiacibacter marinus]|uniref:Bacteriophage phiJL001 Gp84 C-terminal domain-containing protein n=1 Tax=Aurantiacibacter marinus TaxID=874156 RepID=A0A0H0XQK1_9SPHN|nr:DUF2163 domain-containing protein [Aurantiacibacter marinus]KLI64853.1 hypothetical protein AAV99_04930 [Aurantiacibacter marinus]
MSHIFFARELEGVVTWWSIKRRDGVSLGFTSHNQNLAFGDMIYRAAPGMIPSAIRRTASLERDAVEVEGVLSHNSISQKDLEAGRFADARVAIGLVDWETLEHATLFHGTLGSVSQEDGAFSAELRSAKARLEIDLVPRTSPTCRASFCDYQCGANAARFTHLCPVISVDLERNSVSFAGAPHAADMRDGQVKWLDGALAGVTMQVIDADAAGVVLDKPLSVEVLPGQLAYLREGCDHTISTCNTRFGNAVNFRGEPHLPGNDLLARYPTSSG